MTSLPTVLVTGIGGSIGVDIARSLGEDQRVRSIGVDCSPWGRRLGQRVCNTVREIPRADTLAREFLDGLKLIIKQERVGFTFVNPDPELEALAKLGELPPGKHSVPRMKVLRTCLDKAATANWASNAGFDHLFPATRGIAQEEDINRAFEQVGSPLWLRARVGPGGRGSLPVREPSEALAWIQYWRARNRGYEWMLQEFLPGRNYNWTGLYRNGELFIDAAMERLRYFLSDASASGVTGQVADCVTVDPMRARQPADQAVRGMCGRPNGIFSVDLREDERDRLKITEINPRLAGRPWLYTQAGVNFALATLYIQLGRDPGRAVRRFQSGVHLHRQLDVEPVVVPTKDGH